MPTLAEVENNEKTEQEAGAVGASHHKVRLSSFYTSLGSLIGHNKTEALPSGQDLIRRATPFIDASQVVAQSLPTLSRAVFQYAPHSLFSPRTHQGVIDTRLAFVIHHRIVRRTR